LTMPEPFPRDDIPVDDSDAELVAVTKLFVNGRIAERVKYAKHIMAKTEDVHFADANGPIVVMAENFSAVLEGARKAFDQAGAASWIMGSNVFSGSSKLFKLVAAYVVLTGSGTYQEVFECPASMVRAAQRVREEFPDYF
jgi:hypothetical protein